MTDKALQDGGAAFAAFAVGPSGDWEVQEGMSLRDWFAGNVAANHMQLNSSNVNEYRAKTCAKWAYMVADAMIAARSQATEGE